jgi:D-glycero-alpha-D-manno-heptose-7-phosphate kinase
VRYAARVPLRIDFGGWWTDATLYADAEGGAVLSAAIAPYVRGYISRPTAASVRGSRGWAARLRGERTHFAYTADIGSGARLGATTAQTVLWVTLIRSSVMNSLDRFAVAAAACRASEAVGILGGVAPELLPRADAYASALGGIRYFTFQTAIGDESITPSSANADELRSRLFLVYAGKAQPAGPLVEGVWSRYRERNPTVVATLSALKSLAGDMKEALRNDDFDAFGELIAEHWKHQRGLSPEAALDSIDEIIAFAGQNGAAGAKALGAGGGGSVLIVARSRSQERLRDALARRGLRIVDFEFDSYGVYLDKTIDT